MVPNHSIRIFDGATAIVTGGASGIGRALAQELAKQGCEVVLADLQVALAEEVASEICASGGKAKAIKIDVSDFPAMEQFVRETVRRTGRLNYLLTMRELPWLALSNVWVSKIGIELLMSISGV